MGTSSSRLSSRRSLPSSSRARSTDPPLKSLLCLLPPAYLTFQNCCCMHSHVRAMKHNGHRKELAWIVVVIAFLLFLWESSGADTAFVLFAFFLRKGSGGVGIPHSESTRTLLDALANWDIFLQPLRLFEETLVYRSILLKHLSTQVLQANAWSRCLSSPQRNTLLFKTFCWWWWLSGTAPAWTQAMSWEGSFLWRAASRRARYLSACCGQALMNESNVCVRVITSWRSVSFWCCS